MHRRLAAAVAAAVLAVVAIAAPAAAAGSSGHNRRISIVGDITIGPRQTVKGPVVTIDGSVHVEGRVDGDVVVGNGSLDVSGHVHGDVLVVHGDARISGEVTGSVVASDGRVVVEDFATVGKDVISRQKPSIAADTVQGAVKRLDLQSLTTRFILVVLALLWISVTLSVAILGTLFVVMFPKGADTAVAAGRRFGRSLGWGALLGIVGPFVAVLVLGTVVGFPLGFGMLGGLTLFAPLGYVATCLVIGRRWVRSTTTGGRVGAFFAGFAILRILALIPGLGLLVWFLASIYGLGSLAVAAWYGGHYRTEEEAARKPAEAPEQPPTEPTAGPSAGPSEGAGTGGAPAEAQTEPAEAQAEAQAEPAPAVHWSAPPAPDAS